MGATGTGKSHVSHDRPGEKLFLTVSKMIDTLTGALGRLSGTDLECFTKCVTGHRIQNHPNYGNSLVCIDTPGFDDTHLSDMKILEMVSKWLVCMYINFLVCKPSR